VERRLKDDSSCQRCSLLLELRNECQPIVPQPLLQLGHHRHPVTLHGGDSIVLQLHKVQSKSAEHPDKTAKVPSMHAVES
jgi:hypothetical protein